MRVNCGVLVSALLFAAYAGKATFADAPLGNDVEVLRNLEYRAAADDDDRRNLADVYIPAGEGPFPGVVMIHGGAWMAGSKTHMGRHALVLADAGYVVTSINYRLAPKYTFPAQIDDCKTAVRWFRENAERFKLDPNKVGAYGYSAGAHLATLLGTTDAEDGLEGVDVKADAPTTRLQAVVGGGTPCDFRGLPRRSRSLAFFLGGSRAEKPEVYDLASPAAHLTKDDPPTLFFHGTGDKVVPIVGASTMNAEMEKLGIQTELFKLAGKGHIGAFLDPRAPKRAVEFLDKVLK